MSPISTRVSRYSADKQTYESNDYSRRLRKAIDHRPVNSSRSQSPGNASLKSMIIKGDWEYQEREDDPLRLKTMGIENLVHICHDIMKMTWETAVQKQEERKKSPSTHYPWPIIKPDRLEKAVMIDRNSLRRARLLNIITIMYEAASTSTSISQLVRIWREASQHSKQPLFQSIISYEKAFQHLIRKPDDQLLEIALHVSLVSSHGSQTLQQLGKKLGITKDQFDMTSIRDSTKGLQNLIKILRERRLKQKQEQRYIDTSKLPYAAKKKQGLRANVSGTNFHIGKSTCFN